MIRQSHVTQSATAPRDAVGVVPQRLAPVARSMARWPDWPALTLLAIGMGLRIWLIVRGWPTLDSDEAIIGLMGRHILSNGEHPTFYYGQHYMGALEAYLAALFFWLLGPSQVALRLAMLTLVAPFLWCVYLLGRAAYGRAVGLLALAALAVGPAYGLMREAPGIGGYQETLLFGALLPLLAYLRLREPAETAPSARARWTRLAQYAAFGLIAGLGVWSDELVLVFIVAPLLALFLARPRELLSWRVLAALAGGFLIGAAPFLRYNALSRGRTFVELSLQESAGHLGLHELLAQIGSTLSIGIPATFGSPQVCVAPGAVYAGYASYPTSAVRAVALSACQATNLANMLFALAILGVYALAATPLLHLALHKARAWLDTRRRTSVALPALRSAARYEALPIDGNALETPTLPRRAVSTQAAGSAHGADAAPDPQQAARLWLRGMLILAALETIAQYSLSRRTVGPDQFVAVRYLLPLYITLPVVIGPLWEALTSSGKRIGWFARASGWPGALTPAPRRSAAALRRATTAMAGCALALLFVLFALGGVETATTSTDASRFALPATQDQQLMAKLQSLGITAYYGDYWTCYNLVFESGERLHCSSYPRVERYPPYAVYLSHVAHPAYLLLAGSANDLAFQRDQAPTLYHAGYARTLFDGIAVYYYGR